MRNSAPPNIARLLCAPVLFCGLILTGCGGKDADPLPTPADVNQNLTTTAETPEDIADRIGFTYSTANTKVAFNPVINEISLPTFTLFSNSTDGTAQVTIDEAAPADPVRNALNDLDGWSPTAPVNIHFKGAISSTSPCSPYMAATGGACIPNVFLIPLNISAEEGSDVLNPLSIDSDNPINSALLANTQFQVKTANFEAGNDTLRIEPIAPLANKTMYLLAITDGVEDTSNLPVGPSPMYQILSDIDATTFGALGYPQSLASLRTLIGLSETAALGTINQIYTNASLPAISQENIIYTHLFTTTDATTPLNALAHPGAANASLAGLPSAFVDQFANERVSGFYSETPLDDAVSSLPQAPLFPSTAQLIQGAISLPYFLDRPTGTLPLTAQGAEIQSSRWTPSEEVAEVVAPNNTVPADVDVVTTALNGTVRSNSYNVTYRFPFPEKKADTVVPVTVVKPDGVKPADGWPVVVLIHGITQERSSLLLLAAKLADACNIAGLTVTPSCFATVMIDLPLHGHHTDAVNPVLDIALPLESSLVGALPASLQDVQERHFGITYNAAGAEGQQYFSTTAAPSSGSLYINLTHFQNTRDHMKQSVIDHLNLLASLDSMDIDSNESNGADFDTDQVYLAGHSLGGIIGLTTAAVANAGERNDLPRVQATAFLNTGGQVTRLLENSPARGPAIVGGLAAAGINQNTKTYETFFNVFQGTIASGDPINYAAQLTATGTPSYFMVMAGDGSDGSDDQVIPVDANNNPTPPLGAAQTAPLAGSEPLIRQAQAVSLSAGDYTDGDDPAFDGTAANAPKSVAVRFTAGQHSTAVIPQGLVEIGIFNDMVNHISTFFTLNGRGLEVTNTSGEVQ